MNFIEELLARSPEGERERIRSLLRVAVTEGLLLAMEQAGLSKADLARQTNMSRAAITQALVSSRNLSLNTLADLAHAVGVTPQITFRRVDLRREVSARPSDSIEVASRPITIAVMPGSEQRSHSTSNKVFDYAY